MFRQAQCDCVLSQPELVEDFALALRKYLA